MIKNKFISAVIVAAGSSSRMKSNVSKQLIPLMGIPVLVRTVLTFLKNETIDEIAVVCPENDTESFIAVLGSLNFSKTVKFTAGGSTRQKSVFNGVNITDDKCDFVVIHDGARPLVTQKSINDVINNAVKFGASTLAVPVKDTVKIISDENIVVDTPNRNILRAVQTPQVFGKSIYMDSYHKAVNEEKDFTDDCQLVENNGIEVYVTMGDYSNIKVTTPEDIVLAEAFIKMIGESICE